MSHIYQPCTKTHVRLVWGPGCSHRGTCGYDALEISSDHEIPEEVCRKLFSYLSKIVRRHYGSRVMGLLLQELACTVELLPASTPTCEVPECCARKE